MKKLFLLLFFPGAALAQDFEFTIDGVAGLVNGTTQTFLCEGDVTHVDVFVENVSGPNGKYKARRCRIVELAGTQDQICWGVTGSLDGSCYSYDQTQDSTCFTTTNLPTINVGTSGTISSYHKGNGNAGTVHYRYYLVSEAGVEIDSVDIIYESFAGLDDEGEPFSVATAESGTILLQVSYATTLHLFDMNGREVSQFDVESGKHQLEASHLPTGSYIYQMELGGDLYRGKLVLR